jgi:DNA-binding transcriptional MerR regulator
MGIEKKYYSIREVAQMLGVAPSLIRFWESHFVHIRPGKTKSGARRYVRKDIEALQTVYHLVREKGYTLAGAKELLKTKPGIGEMREVIGSLEQLRDFLKEIRQRLSPHLPTPVAEVSSAAEETVAPSEVTSEADHTPPAAAEPAQSAYDVTTEADLPPQPRLRLRGAQPRPRLKGLE